MKAITLHQPWASLIAEGYKTIETRTHDGFKGLVGRRIAIHAGMRVDQDAEDLLLRSGSMVPPKPWPRGVIVCTAFVWSARWIKDIDVPDSEVKHLYAGRFGLSLREVRKVDPPVPARGMQGIWNWMPPAGVVA